ncbi:MAG: SDR family NAD(P)-dependent oxidoreductase [Actinobacteria bacterium]|nr:MAG: SDR family NAD(P)-dependent oxidoreductase [Actinomycetota bacterium]
MARSNKTAVLITGCSSGIGRATAERLARGGHAVYATARRPEAIEDLARSGCKLLPLDVCDDESMAAAVKEVESAEGAVGVLVNNAGYGQDGAVEAVPIGEARRQLETNVLGPLRLTQLALPGMRRAGRGRIVNVSSMGGRVTIPGGGVYHASKYALEALSDALRFEVRGFGVDVVLIEPGLIRTRFGDTVIGGLPGGEDGGPYAEFNEALTKQVQSAYSGLVGKLVAAGPDRVARAIEKAISVERPRARYVVTPTARLMIEMHRLLPGRAFDLLMRTQFPTPRQRNAETTAI